MGKFLPRKNKEGARNDLQLMRFPAPSPLREISIATTIDASHIAPCFLRDLKFKFSPRGFFGIEKKN